MVAMLDKHFFLHRIWFYYVNYMKQLQLPPL